MSILIISVFSLILAVFLYIIISRIPEGEDDVKWVWPFCKSCNEKLSLSQIFIPLNLILFRGKCKRCKSKIYYRILLVNLLTLFVNLSLYIKFGISVQFLAFVFLMSILIAVFFIDFDYKIIPNELVIAGLIGGLLLIFYNLFYEFPIYMDRTWWNPIAGGMTISIILIIIAVIGYWYYKTEAMGFGDVKLFIPIGIFLGWRMVILAFVLSAFTGAFVMIILLVLRLRKLKDAVPYGPFIVTGTFLTILFGNDILNWYLQFYPYLSR